MKSEIELIEDERIDDLQYNNLQIVQNKKLYCFSSDAVLLCNFVKAKKTDTIVDLCSGSGVVGILAKAKTNAKKLILVEKQKSLVDLTKKTIKLNCLTDTDVCNIDIIDAPKILGIEKYDVVCSNPPYYLPQGKKLSGNAEIDMAKFEITLNFESLCEVASKLLKYGGKFYLINDSSRIAEIMETLKKYKLQPKVIEFVFPKDDKMSNVMLIEAKKNGNTGTKVFYKKL